jgi:hypothetical protein
MTRAEMERRLEAAERAAAALPVAGTVPAGLREYLRTLTAEQLDAVERAAALACFAWPDGLSDAEARPGEQQEASQ